MLRRIASGLAALVLGTAGAVAILLYLQGHDQAGVDGTTAPAPPGQVFADQGHRHLRAGDPRPAYDSSPPTSGPHVPAEIRRDAVRLSTDQILHALEAGDVVLLYGEFHPPAALLALQQRLSGPFDPGKTAAGQAVVLGRDPSRPGITALAWRRMLRVDRPDDPRLVEFAQAWLGRGAL